MAVAKLKSAVQRHVMAELESNYYHGRSLTPSDLSALVGLVGDKRFHEEADFLMGQLGPHLGSAMTVLSMLADPYERITPQACVACHMRGDTRYVGVDKAAVARESAIAAKHPLFRELVDAASSAPARELARLLRELALLHRGALWKRASGIRQMASDPFLVPPWREHKQNVTTRDRALLSLLAGSWPKVAADATPESVVQAEMNCLRKLMRRTATSRRRPQQP